MKCHRTRAQALKHLAALQINVPEAKAFSERARESALRVRRHQSALGASDKPSGPGVQMGGVTVNPAIAARVRQILAEKANKGKKKAGGKGKADAAKKKAEAAAKKAERAKEQAAKKQEREKEKLARDVERTAKQASRETARKQKVAERTAIAQAKQAAHQKKLKAAAGAKKEKAKAAQSKQSAAADRKKRVLAEKVKRGEKLSASDQIDAEDAGLVKAGKAIDAFKAQSDEERAMFAKMGGGRGRGKGYNKNKSKLYKNRGDDKAKGGGASSGASESSTERQRTSTSTSGSGPDGRATLRASVSGDMEAHARFVAQKQEAAALRARQRAETNTQRNKAKENIAKIDAIQRELRKRNIPIARLRELQQQLSDIRSGKAVDMETLDELYLAIKAGARHSRTDQQHIQAIHDSAVACGADCATGDDESDDDEMDMDSAEKAIKGIMDNPLYYAQHECGDIMQAANALSTMAMLIQSELVEEDEDDAHISMLCDGARTLVKFISAELDELEGAAGDAADDARMGPMKAVHMRYQDGEAQVLIDGEWKAIAAREDVNPKAGVAEYGNVTFADAKNKKYPIDTADHVRAALSYFSKEENKAKYSAEDQASIMAKIVAAYKKLIDKAGPPSAGKAIDDNWLHIEGDAIKAIDDETVRGYVVLFGDKEHSDLQRDYFTKATDFWLDHFGWPRPITYHHGMDAATRDDPIIGHWMKAGVDNVGLWLEGQLDRAHAYYKAMRELARRGYLKPSTDSAPQWVLREKQDNGTNFVKRWPMISSSLTVTPMEPRMLPVEVKAYLAEIGLDIDADAQAINPDDARGDGLKASDEERARAMLLEWEWFNFEMETT